MTHIHIPDMSADTQAKLSYAFTDNRPAIAIHTSLVNQFFVSDSTIKLLDAYYILHWDRTHMISQLTENGTIVHNDVEYIPIFRMNINNSAITKVRMSFRKAQEGLGIPPYVLIKAAG